MKNCNAMLVQTFQASYKSLSSWVQGELFRRAINDSPQKSSSAANERDAISSEQCNAKDIKSTQFIFYIVLYEHDAINIT